MSRMGWKNVNTGQKIYDWTVVNNKTVHLNIPSVIQWVRKHLQYLDKEEQESFKRMYFQDVELIQHDYTKNKRAEQALIALYRFQQDHNMEIE